MACADDLERVPRRQISLRLRHHIANGPVALVNHMMFETRGGHDRYRRLDSEQVRWIVDQRVAAITRDRNSLAGEQLAGFLVGELDDDEDTAGELGSSVRRRQLNTSSTPRLARRPPSSRGI